MLRDEVRHLTTEADLRLYRSNVGLQIPRELERAIDGLTDGDRFVRRCAQPFIERYIHGLHRSFNLEEIAFGTRCSGSHTNRHTQVIEEETEEQENPEIQFAQSIEEIPYDHREESDDHTDDHYTGVIHNAGIFRRSDHDHEARYDPRYRIQERTEDGDLQDGDEKSRQQEGQITDCGCDQGTQQHITPCSQATRADRQDRENEGKEETHHQAQERHLTHILNQPSR